MDFREKERSRGGIRKIAALALGCALGGSGAQAETFTLQTPGGPVEIHLAHAGPDGHLVSPSPAEPLALRPPSIFSAPLPSGSGARALGFGGAFTAIADDATAASWNPAGLVQLEYPEASVMVRATWENDKHRARDDHFAATENQHDEFNLNYLSLVYPFRAPRLGRNAVVSLNLQESYDFSQRFSAEMADVSSFLDRGGATRVYHETQTEAIQDGVSDLQVVSYLETRVDTTFDQLQNSAIQGDLDYRQEGVVTAISPALAVELTPALSAGLAANHYRDDLPGAQPIRSTTRLSFRGATQDDFGLLTTRTTTGTYEYSGWLHLPADPSMPAIDIPVPATSGAFDPFTDVERSEGRQSVRIDGVYEEINEFRDFEGSNATLGLMWNAFRRLSLGLNVDLPWTADAKQEKTVRTRTIRYEESGGRVLSDESTEETTAKNVEFRFPLQWTLGMQWRWATQCFSSLDVGQTQWSEFTYQAAGEPRINPLDGKPHAESSLRDTWTARTGFEYLILLARTEIPVRFGAAWEQRPALEKPDDYYTLSAGSGLSLGKGSGKIILDVAYAYTWAEDVRGIVPEQSSLNSDVQEHQLYVSIIRHF